MKVISPFICKVSLFVAIQQIIFFSAFSQSKKEQIETLIFQKDSLVALIKKERQLNFDHVKQLEGKISKINSDMALIQKELDQSKKELSQTKKIAIVKEEEIAGYKFDIVMHKDTILSLRQELNQIKSVANQIDNNQSPNGFTIMTFNDLPNWYKDNIKVWYTINDDRVLMEGENVQYIGGWHPIKGAFFFLNSKIVEFKDRERYTSKNLVSDVFEFNQYSIKIDWNTYDGEVHYEGAYLEGRIRLHEKNELKFDSRFWQVGWGY